MFVRAKSKQRFGDVKEPYVNIDAIATVEIGHEAGTLDIKMNNGDELVVIGEHCPKLLAYLDERTL